jgi:alpha-D-xyloside xylohydrolase
MRKLIVYLLLVLVFTNCEKSGRSAKESFSQVPEWKKEYAGTYICQINVPATYNLLSSCNKKPKENAINRLSDQEIPIDVKEVKSITKNGKTYLRFPLDRGEQLYGFGLNFQTVRQRGRIMRLHVDHYGGKDNGRTHAPVPFFVSDKGYGVLINSARYIDVFAGTGVRRDSKNPPVTKNRNDDPSWSPNPYSDNLEFIIPEEGVELIMFTGESMMEVVQRFNLYCGGGFIPPKWGLGFWQRTPTRYTDRNVADEVQGFKDHDFPLDVIGLEPGWHSKAYPCTFEWDEDRFPDPQAFVQRMDNQGVKINLWCNPYVWPESQLDQELSNYHGTHTVWCGNVPDYSLSEPREIFKKHIQKHQLDIDVSGYKVDEVDGFDDWIFPDMAMFPSGLDGEQMRQTYANHLMSMTDELYRANNKRTYGLVRGANAGSVSYPYVLYNDYYSHRDFITALINSSFCGVLWTPEVRASKSDSEWLRRMQTTCFSPMAMINAWADGTKPWSFPQVYESCQDVAFLRMQLLPYLYSTFAQYYFEGKPPFRAMELVEGYHSQVEEMAMELDGTDNPYAKALMKEVKDQYMMGDYVLVAPMFDGETSRKVILPEGKWYDFYTGKLAGESEVIEIEPANDKIPLLVRDGGIIPMIKKVRNAGEWQMTKTLEVRVYGTQPGAFTLYDDNGYTYDYEKGHYSITQLNHRDGKGSIEKRVDAYQLQYENINWVFFE